MWLFFQSFLQSIFGLFILIGIAFLLSNNRRRISAHTILFGLFLQFTFAFLVLKTTGGKLFFAKAQEWVEGFLKMSNAGATFVFGETFQQHPFAFMVLPTIIFVSASMTMLFHLGIMQKIVQGMAWVMAKTMRTSGAESLAAAAEIFMGHTESPLVIRPYITTMTPSEILAMMTAGMATVAGGVLAVYVSMGVSAGHLIAASIMSAPGALMIAKIIYPETGQPPTLGKVSLQLPSTHVNIFDAVCNGAADGVKLAINVAAMLIAFISLVTLVNVIFEWGSSGLLGVTFSFQKLLGWGFSAIAFCIGIEWKDCINIGQLLGTKMVLNEMVAYLDLQKMMQANLVTQRSITIATYALCGFANFSSIAIQIGGVGNLVPDRQKDFAKLGLRAMIGGTLASCISATIAGILIL